MPLYAFGREQRAASGPGMTDSDRTLSRQCTASVCGRRSPLNYDHTRHAICTLPVGHDGKHRMAEFSWRDGFMPSKDRA